jgi:hypothetical protein
MKHDVWVLAWRFELESNAQQTESVETAVFLAKEDAVRFARREAAKVMRLYYDCPEWGHDEAGRLEFELSTTRNKRASSLVRLSDGDNLVFELAKKCIRGNTDGQ